MEKYRLPILILIFGMVLMLLPGASRKQETQDDPAGKLQELLSLTKGVGAARVLISENGVVVACAGAEDPQVRLELIRAIGSYTGFGSERITILKLMDFG